MRVEIGRLRAKRDDYYSLAGKRAPVRIEIPKGSYVSVFGPPLKRDRPEQRPIAPSRRRIVTLAVVGVVACAALGDLVSRYLSRAGAINSVVVLPFVNLTGDVHNDYLADGLRPCADDTRVALRVGGVD